MSCASCSTNVQVHVGARVLLYEGDVSQFPAGRAPRFFAGQTLRLALAGLLFQVELEFLLKFGFLEPDAASTI